MTRPPLVTVVIPARNERASIAGCLESVLCQDYPADRFEVIVADGMSQDGTREEVGRIAAADPRVRLIDNPGRIVPTGMNRAIARARGEIIVRVDGHTVIEPDYVTRAVETIERRRADGVGGTMTPIAAGPFSGAVALATSTPFGVGNSAFHYATTERESDSVYLGAYPRATFERFGGYDQALVRNQDDELNYRIRRRGGTIVLNPAIRSRYHPRGTPRKLFSQYFQYGWWKIPVMARVPSMMSARHFVPSAFVIALAAAAGIAIVRPSAWPAVAALIGAHALLSLLFAAARMRPAAGGPVIPAGGASLALVPLATLIIHVSYGIGLLAALPGLLSRPRPAVGPIERSQEGR